MAPQERSRDDPEGSKTAQKHSRSAPGTLLRCAWSVPRRSLSAVALLNAFRGRRRTIFDRYGFDAQHLRSARRTGFYDVFSMLDVLRNKRSWHAKTSKKQAFRARKSRLGASWGGPDEQVRAAQTPSRATKRVRSSHIEPIEGKSSQPGRARSLGQSPRSSEPGRSASAPRTIAPGRTGSRPVGQGAPGRSTVGQDDRGPGNAQPAASIA